METTSQYVDFSSLSQEEVIALQNVLLRQKEFEELNGIRRRELRLELTQFEERLALAEESATDRQLCQICFKTKVADCLRLNCRSCSRKTCSRCGSTELGRMSWMCQLCSKKRHCLTCTGDWYVGNEPLSANAQYFLDKLEASSSASMTHGRLREPTTPRFSTNEDRLQRLQSTSSRGTSLGDPQDTYSVCNEPEYLNCPVNEPRRLSVSDLSIESEFTSCFSVSTHSDYGMPTLHVVEATESECDSSENSRKKKILGGRKKGAEESRDLKGRPTIERLTLTRKTSNQQLISKDAAFGVRVVGGKTSVGGIMGAFVVAVIPGTNAEESLCIGDQVIEWNNRSLVDATFEGTIEEVASSPDEVSIVVCHVSKTDHNIQAPRPSCSQLVRDAIEKRRASFAREARSCTSQDELIQLILSRSQTDIDGNMPCFSSAPAETNISETKNLWSYSSENDKRSGLKISLWYDPGGLNLIIKILQAQRLSLGTTPGDELPNPYAVVNLLPLRNVSTQFRTGVQFQTQSPVWNLTFIYSNITKEKLSSRSLEVTLWSERKTRQHRFLGKIKVELNESVLSNIPQWYDLDDYLTDGICIPANRRHTLSSGEDVTKLYVGINKTNDQCETSKPRRTRSSILRSYQFHRTATGELLSDVGEGFSYKRRKTNSIRSRIWTGSLSSSRLLALTTSKGKTPRLRRGSENTFKLRINSVGKNLTVTSISSAPTTPCYEAFDKSPGFGYPSLAFDYLFDYDTACKGEQSALTFGSSSSSKAYNSQGQSLDLEDKETLEDKDGRGHEENKEEEHPSQIENDKQERKPEADEAVCSVKQMFVRNISLNLREGSGHERARRSTTSSIRSARPRPERWRSSTVRRNISQDSFMFGDDPELGTIGPSQIRCHGDQDLGYLRLGLSIKCGVLEVDIIRAILSSSSSTSQPGKDTYIKTYLVYNEKKILKRKSSTVRQDLSPVYNCTVKYAARDIDNKILNVCVWQNPGLFGRNVPVGEVHISLERFNNSCKFVAWYKLFPLLKLS